MSLTKKGSIKKSPAKQKKRASMSVFNMTPFGSTKKKEVKRTTSVISYDSLSNNAKGNIGDKKTANSFVISNQGSNSDDSGDFNGIPVTVDFDDKPTE